MLLSLLVAAPALADCAAGSLSAWPEPATALDPEGQIVLHAYGSERKRLASLDADDVALVSGQDRVAVRVVGRHGGSFRDTQLVLAPSRPLEAGRTWTIELDGEALELWWGGVEQPVRWEVQEQTGAPLAWQRSPQVTERSRVRFGCGPAVTVGVEVPVQGAVWIEATVWAARGGSSTSMRLPITDGTVSIGHGMCGGAFALEQGREYFATLVALDSRGARAPADDSPIRFTAP